MKVPQIPDRCPVSRLLGPEQHGKDLTEDASTHMLLSSKTRQCFDPPVQQGNPFTGWSKSSLCLSPSVILWSSANGYIWLTQSLIRPLSQHPIRGQAEVTHRQPHGWLLFQQRRAPQGRISQKRSCGQQHKYVTAVEVLKSIDGASSLHIGKDCFSYKCQWDRIDLGSCWVHKYWFLVPFSALEPHGPQY